MEQDYGMIAWMEQQILYGDLGKPHLITEVHIGYIGLHDPQTTSDCEPTIKQMMADARREILEPQLGGWGDELTRQENHA